MRRSMLLFSAICLSLAILFVQLGRWQLDRRAERRAINSVVAQRAAGVAVPITQVADSTSRFRQAFVSGVAEYDREMVLVGRSRGGSPGVHLLTPVRVGADERVLVNRGWVYSPDAASVDRDRWREGDTVTFAGWVENFSDPALQSPATLERPRALRRVDHAAASAIAGAPLAPVILVVTVPADSAREGVPARIPLPDLTDEGPHLSYAGQWFAFATIAVVGAVIGLTRARRREESEGGRPGSNGAVPLPRLSRS
jgi:surfeit locus 1 family protein